MTKVTLKRYLTAAFLRTILHGEREMQLISMYSGECAYMMLRYYTLRVNTVYTLNTSDADQRITHLLNIIYGNN